MSNRYLKKIDQNRRKKAGISPVVATVILVAVAVVIAAALAGFSGSLFGSYSNGPQIKVKSLEILSVDNGATGTLTLSNAGNQADTVQSISLGDHVVTLDDDPATMPANTDSKDFDFAYTSPGDDLVTGQQVSAIVKMQSGAQITQTITVS
jgi:flagellin-like protein